MITNHIVYWQSAWTEFVHTNMYKACTSIPKLLELHFVQRTWGEISCLYSALGCLVISDICKKLYSAVEFSNVSLL